MYTPHSSLLLDLHQSSYYLESLAMPLVSEYAKAVFRAVPNTSLFATHSVSIALLHAMRIGNTHRDVAILLVGAFSRYVNHLEEEDLEKIQTKTLLKALRT